MAHARVTVVGGACVCVRVCEWGVVAYCCVQLRSCMPCVRNANTTYACAWICVCVRVHAWRSARVRGSLRRATDRRS